MAGTSRLQAWQPESASRGFFRVHVTLPGNSNTPGETMIGLVQYVPFQVVQNQGGDDAVHKLRSDAYEGIPGFAED